MKTLARRLARSAALIAAAAVLASCDVLGLDVGNDQLPELERQRLKWESGQITSYRFTYRRACFCGTEFLTPTEIEVQSGEITSVRYLERDDPVPVSIANGLPTVPGLFAIIEHAIDNRADLLEVTYDPALGHPTKISIDYRFNIADDEITHLVASLTPG